jgi:hypothetical protein
VPDTGWLIAAILGVGLLILLVANQHGVNRRRAYPTADERGYGPDQTPTGFEPAPPDDDHNLDQWDLPDRTPGVHINRLTHLNGHHPAGEEAL